MLARYALMDRVNAAVGTARSLSERHDAGCRGGQGSTRGTLARRFALQLMLVEHGVRTRSRDAPVEVVLSVEPAMDGGGDAGNAPVVRAEFRHVCGWAARRHMQVTQRELPAACGGTGGGRIWRGQPSCRAKADCTCSKAATRPLRGPRATLLHCGLTANAVEIPLAELQEAISARAGDQQHRAALSHGAFAAGARYRARLAHGTPAGSVGRRFRSVPARVVKSFTRPKRSGSG